MSEESKSISIPKWNGKAEECFLFLTSFLNVVKENFFEFEVKN